MGSAGQCPDYHDESDGYPSRQMPTAAEPANTVWDRSAQSMYFTTRHRINGILELKGLQGNLFSIQTVCMHRRPTEAQTCMEWEVHSFAPIAQIQQNSDANWSQGLPPLCSYSSNCSLAYANFSPSGTSGVKPSNALAPALSTIFFSQNKRALLAKQAVQEQLCTYRRSTAAP